MLIFALALLCTARALPVKNEASFFASAPIPHEYTYVADKNCWGGKGCDNIDNNPVSVTGTPECTQRCDADDACGCVVYQGNHGAYEKLCWKRKQCDASKFVSGDNRWDVYIKGAVKPTPTPPTPPSPPTPSTRRGSFLVLGDWGWNPRAHGNIKSRGCQQGIADAMEQERAALGDVQFVVNVGDSFYASGVESKSDPLWDSLWRDVYSKGLRSVPWLSVYGNHDLGNADPCICDQTAKSCVQLNGNISDTRYFYMPRLSFNLDWPALDLEVVAMDGNNRWLSSICYDKYGGGKQRGCVQQCAQNLKQREQEGFDLFYERVGRSERSNIVAFSHYPSDYYKQNAAFLAALRNDTRNSVTYFGGHRHETTTSSVVSTAPNQNWVVGGGGGWGCDGPQQGFLVGEVGKGGGKHAVKMRFVGIPYNKCCK